MQRFLLVATAAVAAIVGAGRYLAAAEDGAVPYPEGYRSWQFVKAELIGPGHELYALIGGLHYVYANAKAVDGYRKGRFDDGSVLVFDLFEAAEEDHAVNAGQRRAVFVMHKDAKRYASSAGWGWEGFAGGDPGKRQVDSATAQKCVACHGRQKKHDYVFTRLAE